MRSTHGKRRGIGCERHAARGRELGMGDQQCHYDWMDHAPLFKQRD